MSGVRFKEPFTLKQSFGWCKWTENPTFPHYSMLVVLREKGGLLVIVLEGLVEILQGNGGETYN